MPPAIEGLRGQRVNSRVYFLNDEPGPYHLDSRYTTKNEKYYRCSTRSGGTQCGATFLEKRNGAVTRYGIHNHPIDPHAKLKLIFREQVRQLAQNIQLEPAEVLRQASLQNPEAGQRCSAAAITSFIQRIREDLLPAVPATLADLGADLVRYALHGNIHQGTVTAGGASAVIFASLEMLELLNGARWLHIDGTFSDSHG